VTLHPHSILQPSSSAGSVEVRLFTAAEPAFTVVRQLLGSVTLHPHSTLQPSSPSGRVIRVGFEEHYVTYAQSEVMARALDCELVPSQSILTELRMVKSERELERMREAQRLTDAVFDEILTVLKPGMTEKAVAAELIYRMLRHGADGVSFDPIVASGANSSMPHAVPSDKPLQSGEFVTMDFGCVLDGYCSDMTRTVALGGVSAEMRAVYAAVRAAQAAGIAAAHAGVPGKTVHMAAERVIDGAGYAGRFGHGFGHGLGLEVHESPRASAAYDLPLHSGSVISAEPGIYLPGQFGVRIEDVLIIRDGFNENITHSPKELIVL
jgi:Xaa-Pro aminopeptidase